jgi:hypothetical protein
MAAWARPVRAALGLKARSAGAERGKDFGLFHATEQQLEAWGQ